MQRAACQVYNWLMSQGIDPAKVKVVLRADDEMTRDRIVSALKHELQPQLLNPDTAITDLRGLKLHGIAISFSTLDDSRG